MADTPEIQDNPTIQPSSLEEGAATLPTTFSLKHGATYKCDIFMGQVRLIEVKQSRSIYVCRLGSGGQYWMEQEFIDGEQPAESFHLRSL